MASGSHVGPCGKPFCGATLPQLVSDRGLVSCSMVLSVPRTLLECSSESGGLGAGLRLCISNVPQPECPTMGPRGPRGGGGGTPPFKSFPDMGIRNSDGLWGPERRRWG